MIWPMHSTQFFIETADAAELRRCLEQAAMPVAGAYLSQQALVAACAGASFGSITNLRAEQKVLVDALAAALPEHQVLVDLFWGAVESPLEILESARRVKSWGRGVLPMVENTLNGFEAAHVLAEAGQSFGYAPVVSVAQVHALVAGMAGARTTMRCLVPYAALEAPEALLPQLVRVALREPRLTVMVQCTTHESVMVAVKAGVSQVVIPAVLAVSLADGLTESATPVAVPESAVPVLDTMESYQLSHPTSDAVLAAAADSWRALITQQPNDSAH